VVEQVADRDTVPLGRDVRQELLQRVVERELPLLHQAHDGRARELLGDRADAIDRLDGRRHVVLEIREPVPLREDRTTVLHHRDGDARGALLGDGDAGNRVDVMDERARVLGAGGGRRERAGEQRGGVRMAHE
jgi:hypothetical protein